MKTKTKIQNKISDLEAEIEKMEQEVISIVTNSHHRDWARVRVLVNGITILYNQIEVLKGLY